MAFGMYYYLSYNYFIITGYAAKKACGCGLLAERDIESIKSQDLAQFPLSLVNITIDKSTNEANASLLGYWKSKAMLTKDRGCILINNEKEEINNVGFPNEKIISTDIDTVFNDFTPNEALESAVDYAFDKENEYIKKTRGLLVIKDNKLIAERYAKGFDKDTKILGWSMNKSICNTLIGILVKQGKTSLNEQNLFSEWSNDQRKNITLDDLLRMRSGLKWDEIYTHRADATQLLFETYSCGDFAIDKELEFDPGTYWEYSSGTTNILSRYIRDIINNDEAYLRFPYDSLFNKLGMNSMVLDTDQEGNYILSSYGYATIRDWAKYGLLYANEGRLNGDQIISKEWVNYSKSITENSTGKCYGSHFWLNTDGIAFPNAPHDLYYASGYQGQYVFIIPSKNAVIVRMGLTQDEDFDMNGVLSKICAVI